MLKSKFQIVNFHPLFTVPNIETYQYSWEQLASYSNSSASDALIDVNFSGTIFNPKATISS
jgi:hypothetical protein